MSIEENKAQILKVVDSDGNETGDFYVVIDTGGVKFVFKPTQSYEETLEIYKDVIEVEETDSTEIDFEKRFIDDDLMVYWGEIDQYTDTTEDVINSIKTASANEIWWKNESFRNAYVDIWENSHEDGVFDSDKFLADLRASNTIAAAFGEEGVTKETFNRSIDERLDPDQFILDDTFAKTMVYETAIAGLGPDGADIVNDNADLKRTLDLLAFKYNSGHFGKVGGDEAKAHLSVQITALIDPSSRLENGGYYELESDVANSINGIEIPTTTKKESEVEEILNQWVPSSQHGSFDIASEAAKLRRNPLYKTELIEKAKNAKFAQYSMYDKDIDWNTIKAQGVNLISNAWGVTPKDDDPILHEVLTLNDTNKANAYLRAEGLKVGNEKVKNDYAKAVAQAYGDDIIRTPGFTEGRY
tara:strand:+ start:23139 stop:24380 length:1242 start_codon:yes stop_codon:yes gene_type:complete